MNNPNQPREFDAVLGGQAPPPTDGVVLGGIEGVKQRLKSSNVEIQIAALTEAMNYGETGLDVVIDTLERLQEQIQYFVARLLRDKGGQKGKQALLDYNPQLFFKKLENWTIEDYNPKVGIIDPVNTAYRLKLDWNRWRNSQATLPNLFESFLKDSQASQVEALLLPFGSNSSCKLLVNALVENNDCLTNLKALYIGDMHDYEYKTSDVTLSNMSPILEAYPHLEILQVRGFGYEGYDDSLKFNPMRHEHLKTLIVETGYVLSHQVIQQICTLELPSLEYLELWLGNDVYYPFWQDEEEPISIDESAISNLAPIISGEVFPHLKYLGLRSSNCSDVIAESIVKSPLMNSLRVLDLSMGTLKNKGANVLLNCSAINNLHTLNVSRNLLSTSMIQQLSQLKCRVIAEPQTNDAEWRYHAITE